VLTVGRVVVAVLLIAGSPAACGEDTAAPEVAPDTLILRVQEFRGGPAPWERGMLPAFSLYGGGRVVIPGGWDGARQRAQEFRLPVTEFEQLVADAGDAGLSESRVYEDDDTSDASLLLVSLRTTDGVHITRVTAPEASGARQVADYVEQLPTASPTAQELQPTALAVLATGGVAEGPTLPWPRHSLAEGTRTTEGMCTVVTGGALAEVMRLAASAAQQTRWSSGGNLYAVSFRPLLPDEHTCGDIDTR
jgi:hypothetical protein